MTEKSHCPSHPNPYCPLNTGDGICELCGYAFVYYLDRDHQQREWRAAKEKGEAIKPKPKEYRDPVTGMEFVWIEGGSYLMGSPEDEPERGSDERQHSVTLQGYWLGKYAVTFEEYDLFAEAKGREKPDDEGWGRGRRPVINVSWDDAVAYAIWLSQETGMNYRLPSEAEFEYAARAGTTTPFSTGNCIHTDQANYHGFFNYNGCGAKTGVFRTRTLPVGSLDPNPWGLYDMHGNVWEWIRDCWNPNYDGAPTDGSAWEQSDCSRRVTRGGSWDINAGYLRSANRHWSLRGVRYNGLGFRLARDAR